MIGPCILSQIKALTELINFKNVISGGYGVGWQAFRPSTPWAQKRRTAPPLRSQLYSLVSNEKNGGSIYIVSFIMTRYVPFLVLILIQMFRKPKSFVF